MQNEKGFTLIEASAAIIVLGIIMLVFSRMPLELITVTREISYTGDIYHDSAVLKNMINKDLKRLDTKKNIFISDDNLVIGGATYQTRGDGVYRIMGKDQKKLTDRSDIVFGKDGSDKEYIIVKDSKDKHDINLKFGVNYSSFQRYRKEE